MRQPCAPAQCAAAGAAVLCIGVLLWRRRSTSRTASRTWGTAAARGRVAHQRNGRRRDDHRHRAGPRDDPGRFEVPRRGHEPDGPQARYRPGRRVGGAGAEGNRPAFHHLAGDHACRGDLGQQRPLDRRVDRPRDGQGRARGRGDDRGRLGPGERAGSGRRHAVRPRLPVALLHQQRREASGRAGERGHRAVRPEAVHRRGVGAAARGGRQVGGAAAVGRRRRGRRRARHAGRQQRARRHQDLCGEGARIRRSPQGHAAGHGGADRRHGDHRRAAPDARQGDAGAAGPRAAGGDRQGQHDDHRRGRRCAGDSRPRRRNQEGARGADQRLRAQAARRAHRQAGRRRGLDQGRRGHRDGIGGTQGARRGRAACDTRRARLSSSYVFEHRLVQHHRMHGQLRA